MHGLHLLFQRLANQFIWTASVSLMIGKVRGLLRINCVSSMIDLINHLVMLDMHTVDPERILLLTPHCLQESSCSYIRVTHEVEQCGR